MSEVEQAVVEGDSGDERGVEKVVAGRQVIGVGQGLRKVGGDEAGRLPGQKNRVGRGGLARGGLDDVIEGVDGDKSRLFGREARHEGRIVDGVGRVDAVVGDGRLVVLLGNADDGETVRLRPRSVGEVDGDDGHGLVGDETQLVEVPGVSVGVLEQNGGALGGVDGAAPADGDDGLGPEVAAHLDGLVDAVHGGVGRDPVVEDVIDAVSVEGGPDVIPGAGAPVGAAARDAEDLADPPAREVGHDGVHLGDGPHTEVDRRLGPDLADLMDGHFGIPHKASLLLRLIYLSHLSRRGENNTGGEECQDEF